MLKMKEIQKTTNAKRSHLSTATTAAAGRVYQGSGGKKREHQNMKPPMRNIARERATLGVSMPWTSSADLEQVRRRLAKRERVARNSPEDPCAAFTGATESCLRCTAFGGSAENSKHRHTATGKRGVLLRKQNKQSCAHCAKKETHVADSARQRQRWSQPHGEKAGEKTKRENEWRGN